MALTISNSIPTRLRKETLEKLKKLKIHPNQSYDELINIILVKIQR